jgi:hypothetical protein
VTYVAWSNIDSTAYAGMMRRPSIGIGRTRREALSRWHTGSWGEAPHVQTLARAPAWVRRDAAAMIRDGYLAREQALAELDAAVTQGEP